MSSQKGNVKKSKPPKHNNKTVFKNTMHDTSKRTKSLNEMSISGVCSRCKDVIEWKIKYKKYKPLTQAKKCTKCQQRTVKQSYTIICATCREAQGVCAKCGISLLEMEGKAERNQEALSSPELAAELNCRSGGVESVDHRRETPMCSGVHEGSKNLIDDDEEEDEEKEEEDDEGDEQDSEEFR